jgi:EmrB/QacA subfamily drug resistance transporter
MKSFALLLAVLSFSLLQTMPVPALPDLQRQFGAAPTTISWVLSAFLLTASVATGLLGRLGDMFGKRKVLLYALTTSAAGTLLAALAPDVGVLIAARAVQGVGAATFPLAFGIVREQFSRERVPVAIGWISSTFGVGFGVGLVVPGIVVDALGWRWIFWVMLLVIVAAIAAVSAYIQESPTRSPGRVDWVGALLLTGGLVALLVAISNGRGWGWASPATLGLLVLAVVSLVVCWVAESRLDRPLLDTSLLRKRVVLVADVTALVIGFGMYGAFTLVPLFVETPPAAGYGFGASVTEAGLFIIPMAVTMLVASPLAGRLGARAGFTTPLVAACVFGAAGFLLLATAHDRAWPIYVANGVLGVGVGFAFASLANLVVAAVDPRQTGEATGVNTIMRTIGGTFGAQLAATIVASTPGESGYTTAFLVSAGAMAVAAVIAPASRAGRRDPATVTAR